MLTDEIVIRQLANRGERATVSQLRALKKRADYFHGTSLARDPSIRRDGICKQVSNPTTSATPSLVRRVLLKAADNADDEHWAEAFRHLANGPAGDASYPQNGDVPLLAEDASYAFLMGGVRDLWRSESTDDHCIVYAISAPRAALRPRPNRPRQWRVASGHVPPEWIAGHEIIEVSPALRATTHKVLEAKLVAEFREAAIEACRASLAGGR
jgi:hypothetical protein